MLRSLVVVAIALLAAVPAVGKNPTPSNAVRNLSENNPEEQKAWGDDNHEIVVAGNIVHVMWITQETEPEVRAIYYKRSIDGGATWEPKKRLFAKNDLLASTGTPSRRMAVDGTNVVIAYGYYVSSCRAGGTWCGIAGYVRSGDAGASWDAPKTFPEAVEVYHFDDIFVAADQGRITVGMNVRCNWCPTAGYTTFHSTDGGRSFVSRSAYHSTTVTNRTHDMLQSGDNVYVLFSNAEFYYGLVQWNLLIAASNNNGFSWKLSTLTVPSKNGKHKMLAKENENTVPKLATAGRNVYVTWTALDENDVQVVYFRRSIDGGQSWEAPQKLTSPHFPAATEFIAGEETVEARGAMIFVVYRRKDSRIFLSRSATSGASFDPPRELTTSGYENDGGWWPLVRTDPADPLGQKVTVLWHMPHLMQCSKGGTAFNKPISVGPVWSFNNPWGIRRPKFAIGPDGAVHYIMAAQVKQAPDFDIFYGKVTTPPAPSRDNQALRIRTGEYGANPMIYDGMAVRPSEDINVKSRFTVEAWVKATSAGLTTGDTRVNRPFLHRRDTSAWNSSLAMGHIGVIGGRTAYGMIRTERGEVWAINERGFMIPDGVWYHYAMTYDASEAKDNLKLYINGEQAAVATAAGSALTADGTFYVGAYGQWDVDELRIWNRPLAAGEILANAQRTMQGGEGGLVAYYNFDGTTKDITGRGNDGLLMYREQFIPSDITTTGSLVRLSAVTNAASGTAGVIAPEMHATLWGGNMASRVEVAATTPLPVTLAGTSAKIKDASGTEQAAPLIFVAPGQINLVTPSSLTAGRGEITLTSPYGKSMLTVNIAKVAPALFSAAMSGKGVAVGVAIKVGADGSQTTQYTFNPDFSANPIDLGEEGDQVYVLLFGTGVRGFTTVSATVGRVPVPVAAAAQGEFLGLDQVNLGPIPRDALRTRSNQEVLITVDGQNTNPLTLSFR
jgi:uncharacterized protein (TIGR03437 family)